MIAFKLAIAFAAAVFLAIAWAATNPRSRRQRMADDYRRACLDERLWLPEEDRRRVSYESRALVD